MIIYFLAVGTYAGSDVGIWHFGTVIVTQCLVVMSIHLAIETKSWTIVHVLSIVLSVAGMEINLYVDDQRIMYPKVSPFRFAAFLNF